MLYLGFTIIPGLNTENGCDGLDEWLQYLICQYLNDIKGVHDWIKPFLLGPKSHP